MKKARQVARTIAWFILSNQLSLVIVSAGGRIATQQLDALRVPFDQEDLQIKLGDFA